MKTPNKCVLGIVAVLPTVLFVGCTGARSAAEQQSSTLTLGETTTVRVAGGGTISRRTFDVVQGKEYSIGVAVDTSNGFGEPVFALQISGDPLGDALTTRSDQFEGDIPLQTFGLPLEPNVVFTAETTGTITVSFTNATQSSVPGVFGLFAIFGGGSPTDTTLQYQILIQEVTE